MITKKVIFATYQIACANNLAPLASRLVEKGYLVVVYASGASIEKWKTLKGIIIKHAPDELDKTEIDNIFKKEKISLLLTGTDTKSYFDFNFRVAAKKNQVPVISFLDFWSYYKERFTRIGEKYDDSFPDMVFVIDSIAKEEIIKIGIEERKISIVGSPHLESVRKLKIQNSKIKGKSILFLSQPISEIHNDDLGLNEINILKLLLTVVESDFPSYHVSIKPHPREREVKFAEIVKNNQIVEVSILDKTTDLIQVFEDHEVVVGIVSTALLEAAVLGSKTLSIQFESNGKFKFFASEKGIIPTAFTKDEVIFEMKKILDKKIDNVDLSYLCEGAADNILRETLKFLF